MMNIAEKIHVLHRAWNYRLKEEKESIRYLLNQDLRGKTVLDIGANKGVYTYWMAKQVGPRGRVIAFEPQPELCDFLDELKKSFGLSNVEVVNRGLSEQAGSFALARSKVGSGGARLKAEDDKTQASSHEITVPVTTLDAFCQQEGVDRLNFIKCDVEGHELSVFRGGEKSLKKHRPTLLFECHHEEARAGHLFSYLKDLDYRGFFLIKGKPVSADKFDQYPYPKPSQTHRNYIFVYEE